MSTHLRPVSDGEGVHRDESDRDLSEQDLDERQVVEGDLPSFEGHQVHLARVKFSGASDLETDTVNHIDDIVRMCVEGRVVRVDHAVDPVSGKMKRIHTIRIMEAVHVPWDFDTGVFGE